MRHAVPLILSCLPLAECRGMMIFPTPRLPRWRDGLEPGKVGDTRDSATWRQMEYVYKQDSVVEMTGHTYSKKAFTCHDFDARKPVRARTENNMFLFC